MARLRRSLEASGVSKPLELSDSLVSDSSGLRLAFCEATDVLV